MKIGELIVQLGVTADTFALKDFAKSIGEIPTSVAAAITSLTGVGLGFIQLTNSTLDLSNKLHLFRAETGLSVTELQRWQQVAQQTGVSQDSVTSSFVKLSQAVAQFRIGKGDPGFLLAMGQMGVDVRGKNAFQIMNELSKQSQKRDPAIASALLGQMGLSPDLLRIFSLPAGQFDKLAGAGPKLTESDMQAMDQLQIALGQFVIEIEKEFVPILRDLIPTLQEFTRAMIPVLKLVPSVMKIDPMGTATGMGATARKKFDNFMSRPTRETEFDRQMDSIARGMNLTVHQTIHSTADAAEVGRVAHEHLKQEKTKANKQFNNGGF